jgi:predicted acetylornithine/succinylornithine family transaminase
MNTEEVRAAEEQYVLHTYDRSPFVLEKGEGVYLYDKEGKRYLDMVSGISVNALGHSDSRILEAIEKQSKKLIHVSNLYHMEPHVILAQSLVDSSFADKVFFCNSGAEAAEGALKFARKWGLSRSGDSKHEVVAFTNSFHGRTMGALSATYKEAYRIPFEPLVPGFKFATYNDLDSARRAVTANTCAVIVEPVQGEGGVNLADGEFLQGLRELCDESDALLLFDEIQSGMGRTGTLFAYEGYGVTPDVMMLAKALGGGLPIGAVLMTDRVAEVMGPGDHGSTFAANMVICAVAVEVLREIRKPGFLESVRETAAYLRGRLEELVESSAFLSEARCAGLLVGLESTVPAGKWVESAYEKGLVICSAGPNVVRLIPPLILNKEHVDEAVEKLIEIAGGLEASDK